MTSLASSLLISSIPKDTIVSLIDIEAFLRRAFPSAKAVNVPRGPLPGSHKGVAYVHFLNPESAFLEASRIEKEGGLRWPINSKGLEKEVRDSEETSLLLKVQPITIGSFSSISQEEEEKFQQESASPLEGPEPSSSCFPPLSRWIGVPLPPHCISYSYRQCAYEMRRKEAEQEQEDEERELSSHGFSSSIGRRSADLWTSDEDGSRKEKASRDSPSSPPVSSLEVPHSSSTDMILAVLPFYIQHKGSPSNGGDDGRIPLMVVVIFRTAADRDKAIECYPARYAPCGPPSLEYVLALPPRATRGEANLTACFCRDEVSTWSDDKPPLRMGAEDNNSPVPVWVGKCTALEYLAIWEKKFLASGKLKRKRSSSLLCEHGRKSSEEEYHLHSRRGTRYNASTTRSTDAENKSKKCSGSGVGSEWALDRASPEDVFATLSDFVQGKGRVAVKDQYGNIVVLCLPAYASSFV